MKKSLSLIVLSAIFILFVAFVIAEKLPTIGSEAERDQWGNILNNYLLVAHTENGTLKNNSVQDFMLNLPSITLTDFSNDAGFLTIVGNPNIATGTITASKLNLSDITLADFTNDLSLSSFPNDVGYLTNLPDSYNSATNAIYLQPNRDGTARVRFFANTTGSPIISIFGYNSVLNSRPWIYAGMFDIGGGGNMRGVIGASGDYGDNSATMEIQSPYQVRITGVDNNIATGNVRIASRSYVTIHPRTLAETDSAKYLTIDTVGQVQGANVEISTNSGDLVLNPAGDVKIKNGFTGTCASTTTLTVVNGIITACS